MRMNRKYEAKIHKESYRDEDERRLSFLSREFDDFEDDEPLLSLSDEEPDRCRSLLSLGVERSSTTISLVEVTGGAVGFSLSSSSSYSDATAAGSGGGGGGGGASAPPSSESSNSMSSCSPIRSCKCVATLEEESSSSGS